MNVRRSPLRVISRRFGPTTATSGLTLWADILRNGGQVSKVPLPDITELDVTPNRD
jgi:hypothetical protein